MKSSNGYTVDVIIPSYKPKDEFYQLLKRLSVQSYPVNQVIVMNTQKEYWDETVYQEFSFLQVHHIEKQAFDHGRTRDIGASYSQADVVLFMTDDALPADTRLVETLVREISNQENQVVMAYARQLPRKDAGVIERITRGFNYPEERLIKTKEDLSELGIKTYFASNACCAYERRVYEGLGGFVTKTIFNEDMLFAYKVIESGYAIAYEADAKVIHSHNYTGIQQFRRNFDLAVSQAEHPHVFSGISSEGEGIRLVKKTAVCLFREGKWWLLPKLVYISGCKYMGYFFGKRYKRLPRKMVLFCSMNQGYWQ